MQKRKLVREFWKHTANSIPCMQKTVSQKQCNALKNQSHSEIPLKTMCGFKLALQKASSGFATVWQDITNSRRNFLIFFIPIFERTKTSHIRYRKTEREEMIYVKDWWVHGHAVGSSTAIISDISSAFLAKSSLWITIALMSENGPFEKSAIACTNFWERKLAYDEYRLLNTAKSSGPAKCLL